MNNKNKSMREQRFQKVAEVVSEYNIKTILEIGCGDGKFLPYLNEIKTINRIMAIDKDKKKIDKVKRLYTRVESYCESFLDYHNEFKTVDCIVAIEVIEHLESAELTRFKEIIFSVLKPKLIVFTTPNFEYNVHYPVLYNGFRHSTHVFEFTPLQLSNWGNEIIKNFRNYEFHTDFCDNVGSSQIIVFYRRF